MTEIRLPIPPIVDDLPVEIEIRNTGSNQSILYKIVSFPFEKKDEQSRTNESSIVSVERIGKLKNMIETYDKSWELIQIFAPLSNSNFIQVLFRKK
jgi:hypothetical protein